MSVINPLAIFQDCYEKAKLVHEDEEYNAISLATVDAQGVPSVRIVLLKYYDENGFVFFTNKNSQKAQDISINPKVSGCFFWPKLAIQVRLQGIAEEISAKESDQYFATRIRERQIGAWASLQSTRLESDAVLEARVAEFTKQFKDQTIPRPPYWGGYKIVPTVIEIWQKRGYRLNKRDLYKKQGNTWQHCLLYP